jgi:hypothetical protein
MGLWHIQTRHTRHGGIRTGPEPVPKRQTLGSRGPSFGYRLAGGRRWLYMCGRGLQGFGLLLIWWVLLLFAGAADMHTLLLWSMAAVVVFYLGWVCTAWAKKDAKPIGRHREQ